MMLSRVARCFSIFMGAVMAVAVQAQVVEIETLVDPRQVPEVESKALKGDLISMLQLWRYYGLEQNDIAESGHWLWLAARQNHCVAIVEMINVCESFQHAAQCERWYTARDAHCPLAAADACDGLEQISEIPVKAGWKVDDPVYNRFADHPDALRTCLIDRIMDVSPMTDPRSEPSKVNGFVVGDLAFFLLTDFGLAEYADVLPAEVLEQQKIRGVYAYFEWVQKPGNRERLQQTCRERVESSR